jgi:hypothetical protein
MSAAWSMPAMPCGPTSWSGDYIATHRFVHPHQGAGADLCGRHLVDDQVRAAAGRDAPRLNVKELALGLPKPWPHDLLSDKGYGLNPAAATIRRVPKISAILSHRATAIASVVARPMA